MQSSVSFDEVNKHVQRRLMKRHGTLRGLIKAFRRIDKSRNGQVDAEELQLALSSIRLDLSKEEAEVLVAGYDRDGDGELCVEEFILGVRGFLNPARLAVVHQAFDKLDTDGKYVVQRTTAVQ